MTSWMAKRPRAEVALGTGLIVSTSALVALIAWPGAGEQLHPRDRPARVMTGFYVAPMAPFGDRPAPSTPRVESPASV